VDNIVGIRGKRTLSGARVKEFSVPPTNYAHDINLITQAFTSVSRAQPCAVADDYGRDVTVVDEPQFASDFKCC
jgi:hypothetical protein